MKEWVVLCPGPSLRSDLVRSETLAGKFVVAVNGAVAVSPGDVDFWAVQDIEVFRSVFDLLGSEALAALQFPTSIWTHTNFVHSAYNANPAWHSGLIDALDGFRFVNHGRILTDGNFAGLPWAVWAEFTFFTAIALAIHSGAESIEVLGCDLSEGYFDEGFTNERTQHTAGRWIREAGVFKTYILPVAQRYGVHLKGAEAYADR